MDSSIVSGKPAFYEVEQRCSVRYSTESVTVKVVATKCNIYSPLQAMYGNVQTGILKLVIVTRWQFKLKVVVLKQSHIQSGMPAHE